MSQLYGLIGYPVKHSYSAAMHNAAFQELGINAEYRLFAIEPQNLKEQFCRLLDQGLKGCNITVPYKEQIIPCLSRLDKDARLIGAVNTVKAASDKTTEGFNTDGLGFISHLQEVAGFAPKGKEVSILGAGGAARAVAFQLAKHGAKSIAFFDLEQKKADSLIAALKAAFPQCGLGRAADAGGLLEMRPQLLINASPVGMRKEDKSAFDAEMFYPELFVYDLVYNPGQTALLVQARARACRGIFNGLGMLLYQGAAAFKIWFGIQPPVEVMQAALLERINTGA